VLFLIDATDDISEPDKKLAGYIAEQFKPVMFVINKWDLAREIRREQEEGTDKHMRDDELKAKYREYLYNDIGHLPFAPVEFITAKDGRNVQAVLDLCQHLFKQANQRVTTGRLNAAMEQAFSERAPSTKRGQRPKVYYATQIDVAPPTIVLKVNHAEHFPATYQRYLVNRLRELLPYPHVPIKLLVRGKERDAKSREKREEAHLIGDRARPPTRPAGRSAVKKKFARPAKKKRAPSR
jgi:GTPase